MAGSGHSEIKFDGILTWGEFRKQVILAGRGIPDSATVELKTNGSSNPQLIEQVIGADWDLDEMDDSVGEPEAGKVRRR